jgi:hypothetical protein
MIPSDTIQTAKSVAIADYLAYRGFQPVKQNRQRLIYCSPLREELTPSFSVNQAINRYKDFGTSEAGDDVIQLVQRLDNCSFAMAVAELQRFAGQPDKPNFFLSGPIPTASTGTSTPKSIKLLENTALVRYVDSRRISYPVARRYVREVYYTHNGHSFFAVGFENDKGGFALRNEWTDKTGTIRQVKRTIGPSGYTTITGNEGRAVNVFEGFFDFLSALDYYGLAEPPCTTVVLNSTANLDAALPVLSAYQQVNAYLDTDPAGSTALHKLRASGLRVSDRSSLYTGSKDFNEFWVKQEATTSPKSVYKT